MPSMEKLSLRVGIPPPALPSTRRRAASCFRGCSELGSQCKAVLGTGCPSQDPASTWHEPTLPLLQAASEAPTHQGAGRGWLLQLALPPLKPHPPRHCSLCTFRTSLAASSPRHSNYPLPHPGRLSPVPSQGWMFSS